MKKYIDGKYIELTPEEVAEYENEKRVTEIEESRRPLTESEVNAMVISANINNVLVDDNTALRMLNYYPLWAANVSYPIGFKVQYKGLLYRVIQEHTSLDGWMPDVAPTLFTVINETHTGAVNDPISYSGNMALEKDKYYIENHIIYLCTRDTINPVFNPLSELVGIYVEVA